MRLLRSNRGHKNGARATRTRLALLGVVGLALVLAVPAVASAPRSGKFHVTKECSAYNGTAWSYCTIKSSNVSGLKAESTVLYASAAGASSLDSDVVIYSGQNTAAVGHVTLDLQTLTGRITISGGTGQLRGFRAQADVSVDATGLWHWDGTYSFRR